MSAAAAACVSGGGAQSEGVIEIIDEDEALKNLKYPHDDIEVVQSRQNNFDIPIGHSRTGLVPRKGTKGLLKHAAWGVSYVNNLSGEEVRIFSSGCTS